MSSYRLPSVGSEPGPPSVRFISILPIHIHHNMWWICSWWKGAHALSPLWVSGSSPGLWIILIAVQSRKFWTCLWRSFARAWGLICVHYLFICLMQHLRSSSFRSEPDISFVFGQQWQGYAVLTWTQVFDSQWNNVYIPIHSKIGELYLSCTNTMRFFLKSVCSCLQPSLDVEPSDLQEHFPHSCISPDVWTSLWWTYAQPSGRSWGYSFSPRTWGSSMYLIILECREPSIFDWDTM